MLLYVPDPDLRSECANPQIDAGVLASDAHSPPSCEKPRGGGSSRIGAVGKGVTHQDVTTHEAEELRAAGFDV